MEISWWIAQCYRGMTTRHDAFLAGAKARPLAPTPDLQLYLRTSCKERSTAKCHPGLHSYNAQAYYTLKMKQNNPQTFIDMPGWTRAKLCSERHRLLMNQPISGWLSPASFLQNTNVPPCRF